MKNFILNNETDFLILIKNYYNYYLGYFILNIETIFQFLYEHNFIKFFCQAKFFGTSKIGEQGKVCVEEKVLITSLFRQGYKVLFRPKDAGIGAYLTKGS